jgi:hypothetical protein
MSSWDQASRGEKLGLVWRNRKKISQIINNYLFLPFFLLTVFMSLPHLKNNQIDDVDHGDDDRDEEEAL